MPVLNVTLQGRFGNQCLIWLFCRALAERYRADLCCDSWVGSEVFDLGGVTTYDGPPLPRFNELEIDNHLARGISVEFRGYAQTLKEVTCGQAQMRECMLYTKREAQSWMKINPRLLPILGELLDRQCRNDTVVAHHRKGDYPGYGYPVVSQLSYIQAARRYFGPGVKIDFVSEEYPMRSGLLPEHLSFMADFYRLMKAPTLMRANSTFSFLAGLLGNGLVLSPRIDGLAGAVEHDEVPFEAGNHCRLADFDFCSDLHVAP